MGSNERNTLSLLGLQAIVFLPFVHDSYMQKVEGGYYINGYPYDLDWYGLLGRRPES
jgi:hypothetical protein